MRRGRLVNGVCRVATMEKGGKHSQQGTSHFSRPISRAGVAPLMSNHNLQSLFGYCSRTTNGANVLRRPNKPHESSSASGSDGELSPEPLFLHVTTTGNTSIYLDSAATLSSQSMCDKLSALVLTPQPRHTTNKNLPACPAPASYAPCWQ